MNDWENKGFKQQPSHTTIYIYIYLYIKNKSLTTQEVLRIETNTLIEKDDSAKKN